LGGAGPGQYGIPDTDFRERCKAEVLGISQRVEKLLGARLRASIEAKAPRFCSVLAVFSECLDTI
jgi:hypothetical protein